MKMAVSLIEVQDEWNDKKVWLIKRYKCGHYYFNQKIAGFKLNKMFLRTTKAYLKSIGIVVNVSKEGKIYD